MTKIQFLFFPFHPVSSASPNLMQVPVCPHQKQCNSWSQYKSSHYIWTVVPILWNSVEAGEEGGAERAQTKHGLGQAAGLGLDGAGDVHLEGE